MYLILSEEIDPESFKFFKHFQLNFYIIDSLFNKVPRSIILVFFLAPTEFGVFVFPNFVHQIVERERSQLFNSHHNNILFSKNLHFFLIYFFYQ